jgi:hypothetical protein
MEDYIEWITKEEKRTDGGQEPKSPTAITAVGDT